VEHNLIFLPTILANILACFISRTALYLPQNTFGSHGCNPALLAATKFVTVSGLKTYIITVHLRIEDVLMQVFRHKTVTTFVARLGYRDFEYFMTVPQIFELHC